MRNIKRIIIILLVYNNPQGLTNTCKTRDWIVMSDVLCYGHALGNFETDASSNL